MARVISPGVWTRQPPSVTPLDRTHPSARGLISAYSGVSPYDMVAKNTLITSQQGSSVGGAGLGGVVVVNGAGMIVSPSLSLAAATDFTFVFAIGNIGFAGGNPGVWRAANSFCIFQGSTGRPWIRISNNDVLIPASGQAVAAGQNVNIGFRVRSSVDASFAVNGIVTQSATHATATEALSISNYGWQNATTDSATGSYALILVWNRALTQSEFCSITANPWQLFAPAPSLVWMPPAAAPGGFSPYWATGYNQIVGGGYAT